MDVTLQKVQSKGHPRESELLKGLLVMFLLSQAALQKRLAETSLMIIVNHPRQPKAKNNPRRQLASPGY